MGVTASIGRVGHEPREGPLGRAPAEARLCGLGVTEGEGLGDIGGDCLGVAKGKGFVLSC